MKSKSRIEKKRMEALAAWSDGEKPYFEGVLNALEWVMDEDAPDPMAESTEPAAASQYSLGSQR